MVLKKRGVEQLSLLFPVLKKWQKKRVAIPLCLTEEYIQTSLDTFPVEFLNMKSRYRLVYGEDVLKDLTFEKKYIRLQVERELRGKLLRLRGAYLETSGKIKDFQFLIHQSLTTFSSLFRGILFLLDKSTPSNKREVIKKTAVELGLDHNFLDELFDIAGGAKKLSSDEVDRIFIQYTQQILKSVNYIDQLKTA